MKLNPQAQKILQILRDNEWHCPISWGFADGHCKRISDINNYLKDEGLKVIGEVCKCGRHTAKVYKRRIVPLNTETLAIEQNLKPQGISSSEVVRQFMQKDREVWHKPIKQANTLF